jgi:hypothetical protein
MRELYTKRNDTQQEIHKKRQLMCGIVSAMTSDFWKRLIEATPHLTKTQRSPWLEKLCDVSQASVSRWKRGTHDPSLNHVKTISAATGYCVQWLLEGSGPRRWSGGNQEDVDDLLRLLDGLSEADREEVLRFARFRAVG